MKNENKVNKENKDNVLFIKVETPIPKILHDYAKEAGIDIMELGYNYGLVSSQGEKYTNALVKVSAFHFYAGIFAALSQKHKIEYKYTDSQKLNDIAKKQAMEAFKKVLKEPNKNVPTYMG